MVETAGQKGRAGVETTVKCVIFNNKAHEAISADEARRAERTITLKHGEKMLFGENMDKGLVLNGMKLKVVKVGEDGVSMDDILTHDAHEKDTMLHNMLAAMKYPDYPVALGIIRSVDEPVYDLEVEKQIETVQKDCKIKCMDDLLASGETWDVV